MCVIRFGLLVTAVGCSTVAKGDLLPVGHKSVNHQLVFEDSELFKEKRLVAAPVAGFRGVTVIQPGVPFTFSSKYGTAIYVVPNEQPDPTEFDREQFETWPHALPPVQEVNSLPISNPIENILTTLRLNSVNNGVPMIELVTVKEKGEAAVTSSSSWWFVWPIGIGLVICMIAISAMRSRSKRRQM